MGGLKGDRYRLLIRWGDYTGPRLIGLGRWELLGQHQSEKIREDYGEPCYKERGAIVCQITTAEASL